MQTLGEKLGKILDQVKTVRQDNAKIDSKSEQKKSDEKKITSTSEKTSLGRGQG